MPSDKPHSSEGRRTAAEPGGEPRQPSEEAAERLDAYAEQAHESAHDLKERTHRARERAEEVTTAAREQVVRQAREAADQLRERGRSMLAEQKIMAAARLDHLREAIEAAAMKLRDADERGMAACADVLADRVEDGRRYLRERDVNRLAEDAGEAVRRHPEWVLAGLFLGGLALARFLRSSGEASGRPHEAAERRISPPAGTERDVAAQPPGPGPVPYPPQSEGIGTAGVRRDHTRVEPTTQPEP